jgi:hypothetical protein
MEIIKWNEEIEDILTEINVVEVLSHNGMTFEATENGMVIFEWTLIDGM